MSFSHKVLELDIILDKVKKYTNSSKAESLLNVEILAKDYDTFLQELNYTHETLSAIERFQRFPFHKNFDQGNFLVKLNREMILSIEDVVLLNNFLKMVAQFKSYQQQLDQYTYIGQIFDLIHELNKPLDLIDEIIDENEIKDTASVELNRIRKTLNQKEKELTITLQGLLTKYKDYLNESLIVTRHNRYAIPVKDSYRNKIKGIVHDISQSGQTVFIEPDEIRQITQDIEYLKQLEEKEIYRILKQLSEQLYPHTKEILESFEALIKLDLIHAKALYSLSIRGVLPILNNEGDVSLIQARHPLIDPSVVVPIDIKVDKNYKTLLITGPNTGGKTVALKTVGLLTLFLHAGILIPASENSKMSFFEGVYADIGDEQSIEQNLSTFSSHLTKIKNIIDEQNGLSLILLDELGSGTDPLEGTQLAISIIDYLRKNENIRLLVTTHYSELKLYAYEKKDILLASVAFDETTLKPLYKIQLGVSGSSHALYIAERLGIKKEIIEHAKSLLLNHQTDIGLMLERLSKEQNEVFKLKEELLEKEKELNKQKLEYQEKLELFEREKEKRLAKIEEKELKTYQKLKEELLQKIDELTHKETLTKPESAKLKGSLNTLKKEEEIESDDIQVNDTVYIKSYQQEGIVVAIKKDDYVVAFGPFELTFKKNDLRKVHAKTPVKTKVKTVTPKKKGDQAPMKQAQYELDLRGVRYEDVKDLMDKAIDDALLTNMPFIRVIHGFGTGAVRKAVYEYIKKSPYVKSYRYGGEGEGLNGVTIITL